MVIRLLIVANNLAGGGAEKVLLMLLGQLKPPQYDVELLLIKNKGQYLHFLPRHVRVTTMIDVASGDRSFPTDPRILAEYGREHLTQDYDVEIAFLEGPPTKLLAYHDTPAKKIAWVHTDLSSIHWTQPYYKSDQEERQTYECFNQVVFVSEGSRQGFFQRFGVLSTSSTVITNPTDIDGIRKKSTEYDTPKYSFSFCSVASLCARKGQSRLLYAMGRLVKEGFRFHLELIGDGTAKPFYMDAAQMLDIAPFVHFRGFLYNPYPYIRNSDIFILPSLAEGFPLVLCEALCLHRPIIATDCAGNRDVLHNGAFGLLVDNTEEGLYSGMKRILTDPEFLTALTEKAHLGADSLQFDEIISRIHDLLTKDGGMYS